MLRLFFEPNCVKRSGQDFSATKLQQLNAILCTGIFNGLWPERTLYFTDVCLPKEEHADTGLTDTAADREWKLVVQNCLLERKFGTFRAASLVEL